MDLFKSLQEVLREETKDFSEIFYSKPLSILQKIYPSYFYNFCYCLDLVYKIRYAICVVSGYQMNCYALNAINGRFCQSKPNLEPNIWIGVCKLQHFFNKTMLDQIKQL